MPTFFAPCFIKAGRAHCVLLQLAAKAAAATRARHDVFFECIEVTKINSFNVES
jgi:hypothetical protein